MAAAEAWLASIGAWRRPVPPLLRAEYDRQTRAQRCRNACVISLVGAVVGLGFTPMLLHAVPDMREAVGTLFLRGAVPLSALVALLVLLDMRPLLREALLAVPSLVHAAVLTFLFTATQADATQPYVAGMFLLMLFATVTLQLRFSVALVTLAAMMAMFMHGMSLVHVARAEFRWNLDVISLVCGFYMLLANWRMQREQQRSFALALRERLRRQDLADRNQELDELVRRDALTGLANRRAYDAWLQNCWRQARGAGASLGLILIDVDRFKDFNDFYGHPAGDVCLQTIARSLREQLRGTTDNVARVGGEEFAVLLPALCIDHCADIAERLRAAVAVLELPHLGNGRGSTVTISCGVASLPGRPDLSQRDLVAAADAALYQAKQDGRNLVRLADMPAASGPVPCATAGQTP